MLSEYITSLADVSFHIVASMYVRFRNSRKNQMRFVVFWRISVRFCGFRTPLMPPSSCCRYNTHYVFLHNTECGQQKKEICIDSGFVLSHFSMK